MTSFWKGIKKDSTATVPLAPMNDNCISDKENCNMWQTHYKTLLNSVKTSSPKKVCETRTSFNEGLVDCFCQIDIFNVLKNAKTGNACGVGGLAAEQFIYADAIIHVHLSLLFNCFISHSYLHREFM